MHGPQWRPHAWPRNGDPYAWPRNGDPMHGPAMETPMHGPAMEIPCITLQWTPHAWPRYEQLLVLSATNSTSPLAQQTLIQTRYNSTWCNSPSSWQWVDKWVASWDPGRHQQTQQPAGDWLPRRQSPLDEDAYWCVTSRWIVTQALHSQPNFQRAVPVSCRINNQNWRSCSIALHSRSQGGGQRSHGTPKFLENIVSLCFERRFSKQNSVIRLKSNISAPKVLGWLCHCSATITAAGRFLPWIQKSKLPEIFRVLMSVFGKPYKQTVQSEPTLTNSYSFGKPQTRNSIPDSVKYSCAADAALSVTDVAAFTFSIWTHVFNPGLRSRG